ncbi:MAG: DUF6273 domain-containing protein [Lachnospiraceae bacterium]|nr:DUF6273 domain-containing protein [Lachnospiraceae bacterium]
MRIRFKKGLALITGMILTVSTVVGILPQTVMPVNAAGDKTITGLGTGAITNPTSGAGGWSYVYYGAYGGNAVKYRVLDKAATEFGGNTMLLDCDSTLLTRRFDDDSKVWADSEIKSWLNGDVFLGDEDDPQGAFTLQERAAIASSTKASAVTNDGNGWSSLDYAPLEGEKIFLLDAKEATRPSYGYANTDNSDSNRAKTGTASWWWLRSPNHYTGDDAGLVLAGGVVSIDYVYRHDHGVSPAFNINLSSVIFSSVISGTAGSAGAEYKLTIKDDNMDITPGTVTRSGTAITVPYTISGTNAGNSTQVSVVITDRPWTLGTAVTSGYTYLKLTVGTFGTTGTGTFTLPAAYTDKTCGTDYYVYIVAEDVNVGNATDYASVPVSVTIPAASTGTITAPAFPGPGSAPSQATSEPEPPVNYMQEVEDKINTAIALGGPQTVYIKGYDTLSYHVLEMLKNHPEITLVSEFTYDGLDYRITIPGSAVKLDPSINWYGPKYLFPMFYMYGTDTLPAVQAYLDKYES